MATHTDAKMYVRICECPDPNVPRHFTRDTQHMSGWCAKECSIFDFRKIVISNTATIVPSLWSRTLMETSRGSCRKSCRKSFDWSRTLDLSQVRRLEVRPDGAVFVCGLP